MIRSFSLALGLTTCLSGITALEAKPNPISDETKRQKPYISRVAAKPLQSNLLNNRYNKKSRVLQRSENMMTSGALDKNKEFLLHTLSNTLFFGPHLLEYYIRNPKLLQYKAQRFYAARKNTIKKAPLPFIKKAMVVKKKSPVQKLTSAYKLVPARAVLKLPAANVSLANDNKNKRKSILPVTKATNPIAMNIFRQETPRDVETRVRATPAQVPLSEQTKPETEETATKAASTTPNAEVNPSELMQVRNEAIVNVDKIKTALLGIDLDGLVYDDDDDDKRFLSLTRVMPSIFNILSNNAVGTKGKNRPPLRESLRNVKEILANGSVDYNAISYGGLVQLKTYAYSAFPKISSLISLSDESKIASSPAGTQTSISTEQQDQLVSEVRGKLTEAKELLKDFTPGVSIITVDPKEVISLKESLWNIQAFLTKDTTIPKVGIEGIYMEDLITETKKTIDGSSLKFGSDYTKLVKARDRLNTVLDKLKFGQPVAKTAAFPSSETSQTAISPASAPELPLLERAKPVFSRLDALLSNPNLSLSQEHEGLMNQIIGQLGFITEVKGTIDSNNKDRTAVLRSMIGNLSNLNDVDGQSLMSLRVSFSHAEELNKKLGAQANPAQLIIKLHSK